jgi:hypothetical protein
MRITSIVLSLIVSLSINVQQCEAQANPRHLEEIAYDFERNRLLVFGGSEIMPHGFTDPSGLFELGESGWQQFNGYGPVGRRGHAMIYHHGDKLTYLFGGVTGKDSLLFDTWSWNGMKWKHLEIQSPVKNPEGAYDSKNNSILIYGDASDKTREMYGDDQKFQLWQFKDHKWKMLSESGARPDGPYEMSYDSKRSTLVIPTWTNDKSVVWEWTGNKWKEVPCAAECPPARNRFGLACSSSLGITYLFGGRVAADRNKFLDDFWSWDGKQWRRVESSNSPPALAGLTMEDTSSGIILYGGTKMNDGKTGMTNERWIWNATTWSK